MAQPFRDNVVYDFCIIDIKQGKHRGNPAFKFTFGCISNNESIREVLPQNSPIVGTRLYKFMKALGYKDTEGVEPDPKTFFRLGLSFKAKVMLQYSEGASEQKRWRINFDTIAQGGRLSGNYTDKDKAELVEFVANIATKDGIVMKLRTLPFERVCLYCDMIRDGVVDLQ